MRGAAASGRFRGASQLTVGRRYVEELPGETPNDRNDRAIRVAALWYAGEVARLCGPEAEAAGVVLVSDDRLNREAAAKEGLRCCTAAAYVKDVLGRPELEDVLARAQADDGAAPGQQGGTLFAQHLSSAEVSRGERPVRLSG